MADDLGFGDELGFDTLGFSDAPKRNTGKPLSPPEPESAWSYFPKIFAEKGAEFVSGEGPAALGAITGAKLGTSVGGVPGAIVGGALGAISGEEIKNLWQRYVVNNPNPDEQNVWRKILLALGGGMEGVPLAATARYPQAAASKGMRVAGPALQDEAYAAGRFSLPAPPETVGIPVGEGALATPHARLQYRPKTQPKLLTAGSREMLPPQADQAVVSQADIAPSMDLGFSSPSAREMLPTDLRHLSGEELEIADDIGNLFPHKPEIPAVADIENRLRTIYLQETRNPALTEELIEQARNGQIREVVTKNAEESGLLRLLRKQAKGKTPKSQPTPNPYEYRFSGEVVDEAVPPSEPATMTTSGRAELPLRPTRGTPHQGEIQSPAPTTKELNAPERLLTDAKAQLETLETALKNTERVSKRFPGLVDRSLSPHQKTTAQKLADQIKSQKNVVAELEKKIKAGTEPTPPTLDGVPPPVVPGDKNTAFQRSWRPTQDILRRYVPEVTNTITRAHMQGEQLVKTMEEKTLALLNYMKKETGSGGYKGASEAVARILDGSTSEASIDAQKWLGNRVVNAVAQKLRSEVLDPFITYMDEPQVKELFGNAKIIEDYFPWVQARGTNAESPFQHAMDDTLQRFVRDPSAAGYKSPHMKYRSEGKIPNLNLEEVLGKYFASMRRSLVDAPAYNRAKSYAAELPMGSEIRDLADTYLDFYMNAPSLMRDSKALGRAVDKINNAVYTSTLGLPNIKSPVRNLTQILNTMVEAGPVNTVKGIARVRQGIKKLDELGVLRETPGLEESALAKTGLGKKIQNVFMKGYQVSEKALRGASYEAGLAKNAGKNLSRERATSGLAQFAPTEEELAASNVVNLTQFQYGKVNPIVMNHNPFIKLVMVLNSYPIRQASYGYGLLQDIGSAQGAKATAKAVQKFLTWGVAEGILVGTGAGTLLAGRSPAVQLYEGVVDLGRSKDWKSKALDLAGQGVALATPGGSTVRRFIKNMQEGKPPKIF